MNQAATIAQFFVKGEKIQKTIQICYTEIERIKRLFSYSVKTC